MSESVLPTAIVAGAAALGGAYVLAQGGVIGASVDSEGKTDLYGAALSSFGGFMIIMSLFMGVIMLAGGGTEVIPATVWPLIVGSFTLIGCCFAAGLCVMVGVKAGVEMIREKPELSIWSLLFVVLGEGLAIYGLIITILILGKA